ncbi:MAG: gliding motility-associated ABC transporter substrate-binding protein GldG [Flavobacteriales bacterium]|jgi:gliding-associated putative ABC transporter substrate-binding component GldG|nr:gliding motility-associated ABC transporter substrate-binding protein GldG [Flavobacteriales bacterium]MCB0759323.1 gliding motility-associated ABC transporter substrate-binding protein GldG [Flavobacteriales bacterium]
MKFTKHSTRKAAGLLELGIGIACVLLVLFIGSFIRVRADLTSEKRYTLTPATKNLVDSLKDVVFVKVYLSGELPADLQRLSSSLRDLLDEMRVRNPEQLQYEFTDPSASLDEGTRNKVYQQLQSEGLQYTSIRTREKGSQSEVIVWPGALITYKGKTMPMQLLKSQLRATDAQMVNSSINNLEYEMASAIRQITSPYRARVAFIEGQGELGKLAVQDLTDALNEQYDVSRVRLAGKIDALSEKPDGVNFRINNFDAVIIAKPDSNFAEKDRFILDQFVMNGGKVLWAVDAMDPHLDSLRTNQFSMATPLDLGIDNLLFAYGVRINKDLLLDKQCAPIQIYTRPYGEQPKLETLPFPFEPLVLASIDHPIVSNIDPVHLKLASSIDTIGLDSAHSTILLTTSRYTRVLRNPVRVSLAVVDMDLGLERNNTPYRPVAVLTQGKFRSAFADRLSMPDSVLRSIGFREWSRPTAQIVISDGDAIANPVDREKGTYFPLGYEKAARAKIFGNREFFINAMNYLLDDKSLISIRSRAINLHQLDPHFIEADRARIQAANVVLPIIIGLLGGAVFYLLRKRRYARVR